MQPEQVEEKEWHEDEEREHDPTERRPVPRFGEHGRTREDQEHEAEEDDLKVESVVEKIPQHHSYQTSTGCQEVHEPFFFGHDSHQDPEE